MNPMNNPQATPSQAPTNPPTQAELDAMPPFERFKWLTRHALSAPKSALTNPFTAHQKSEPNKPPHVAE
jgi:hypothetical protein